jgi:kinesin family protein 5
MNANSSRSHLIFQLTLNQLNTEDAQAKVSNLFIVDLAGS